MKENPTFEMYHDNDDVKGTPDEPPKELEPTPDLLTEIYLNASIIFPRGYNIDRGGVVPQRHDVNGNPILRENANPILDSRRYEVEFDNGEVTDLTTNVIME